MSARVFIPETHQGHVIVKRTGQDGTQYTLTLSPGEVDKATEIVGTTLRMLDVPVEFITNSPFVVRFFPDRVYALERQDRGDSMPFRANEGDDLITTLHMAKAMCLNDQTHGRVVPVVAPMSPHLAGDEPT